jgi:hypothetical protein
MRACVFLAVLLCFISPLRAQQSNPPGYIGLFTDETHSGWYVTGTPLYPVEMYICCLPGNLGQICLEFSICYPDNVIKSTVTGNESLISVELGDLENGKSVCYTNCQHGWHWCYHQTLWVTDTEPTICEICPHPDLGVYQFANCEDGYPVEPCIKYTNLYINQCYDYPPPSLWDVSVLSPTEIEAVFDEAVTEETAEDTDNYVLYKRDAPSDSIDVIDAVRRADRHNVVALTLANAMEDRIFYVLRTEGVADECNQSWISACAFPFGDFPDLTVSALDVIPDTIREGCTPIDVFYTLSNVGGYPADPFRVSIRIETTFIDTLVGTRDYAGLDAASELCDSMMVALPPETDSYDGNWVRVAVDGLEQVMELNEGNNTASFNLYSFTPKIISVTDVPDDDGGMVELTFYRSSGDQTGLDDPVEEYEVLRRVDPLPGDEEWSPGEGGGIVPGDVPRVVFPVPDVPQPGVWEVVGSIPAAYEPTYDLEVPTAADSTTEYGMYWSVYMVRAVRPATSLPDTVFYCSCPDSGYSVDDDSATVVLLESFAAAWRERSIEVTWTLRGPALDPDNELAFIVYRAEGEYGPFLTVSSPVIEHEGLSFAFRDAAVEPGETYRYRIEYDDGGGRRLLFETDGVEVPMLSLTLYQNRPNPFNPRTTIQYYLPEAGLVVLDIYDASGRLVTRLVDRHVERGEHHIEWSGCDASGAPVASGVYFYRINTGKEVRSRKMVLLR